jgi:nitronate monooxygenase
MCATDNPTIIQGGMGVAVSGWTLARAVAMAGQLGVVSGTALDIVLARRLQLGDEGGHLRRALSLFPFQEIANRVLDRYFIPGGKSARDPFRQIPMLSDRPSKERDELIVVANFAEVYLAREGHHGCVGINYLEKIQLPTLPSLFGAMLAGVDYVLMGAGIPLAVPAILDQLSDGRVVQLPIRIASRSDAPQPHLHFDPLTITGGTPIRLDRPKFLVIVAASSLAQIFMRKSSGRVDGFVVEGPTAGGHNAPPRGKLQLSKCGEPIYGPRDVVNLQEFREIGLPFWLAGSYASPEKLAYALEQGAAGIQVGTAFAFCQESGLREDIKRRVIRMAVRKKCRVFTDPLASPTGFPFKALGLDRTLSNEKTYVGRKRICDLGFLRHGYERDDGSWGWRCPAEPVSAYVAKGGQESETVGRKCLCNALLANVGLEQTRHDHEPEPPLITCGDDVSNVHRFLASMESTSYSACDVIDHLLAVVMR